MAARHRPPPFTTMSNRPFNEPGWVQVGKVCPDGRRSLWVRISRKPGQAIEAPNGDVYGYRGQAYQIELCAGREGDDCYVSFFRGGLMTPDELVRFSNLEDVLSTAVWVHELIEEKKEYDQAMAENEKENLNLDLTAVSAISSALNALPPDKRVGVLVAAGVLVDGGKTLVQAANCLHRSEV